MSLQLHSVRHGQPNAPAVVILHGLLGSSRNWATIARELGEAYDVHTLDLRNHGNSPHTPGMDWPALCADVIAHLDREGLDAVNLIGHSLGGKIAMRVACQNPERVERLVVADIAPKNYKPHLLGEIELMRQLPLDRMATRKEAEEALAENIDEWAFRQFLMTNLVRDKDGGFRWQVNLDAIQAALPGLAQNSLTPGMRFEGPSLVLAGGRSRFIAEGDVDAMRTQYFPQIEAIVLPDAEHNVHFDDRAGFLSAVCDFLQG